MSDEDYIRGVQWLAAYCLHYAYLVSLVSEEAFAELQKARAKQ